MKSRWTTRSLRLRITPTELTNLLAGLAVEERLSPGSWGITLIQGAETSLVLRGADTVVQLARSDLIRLLGPDTEGVYFSSGHRPPVRFYIEKDYPCVHDRPPETDEPKTETFDAPEGFRARHGSDRNRLTRDQKRARSERKPV